MFNSIPLYQDLENNYSDISVPPPEMNCFENRKDRKKFIRKTFGYFLASILTTFASCLAFRFTDSTNFVMSEAGQALTVLSVVTTFIAIFSVICCNHLLKRSPTKYIIYGLFTIGMSYTIGSSMVLIKGDILIAAIIITSGTTTALTLYAITTESDFTDYGGYYCVILVGLILTGFINIFLHNTILQIIISSIGAITFSCLIVYDVQMIVAQKHIKYKYELDDYIFAAMSLYLDVINFFLYVLQLLTITDQN